VIDGPVVRIMRTITAKAVDVVRNGGGFPVSRTRYATSRSVGIAGSLGGAG
jgi:hypothetical protein